MHSSDTVGLDTHVDGTVQAFIATMTGLAPATQRNYAVALRRFMSAGIPVDANALCCFDARLAGEISPVLSPASRRTYVSALSQYMRWLDAHELLPMGMFSRAQNRLRIQRSRGRDRIPPRMPDPNLPRIVDYYDALSLPEPSTVKQHNTRLCILRNRALVHALLATAGRVGEVLSIARAQIHELSHGRADQREVLVIGKGNKPGMLLLDECTLAAIRAYLAERTDDRPWLFVTHALRNVRTGPRQMARTDAGRVVHEAAQACGLTGRASPHMFRHWTASDMINRGVSMEVVQEFLRHADIATTSRVYAHLMPETVRARVEAYRRACGARAEAPDGGVT